MKRFNTHIGDLYGVKDNPLGPLKVLLVGMAHYIKGSQATQKWSRDNNDLTKIMVRLHRSGGAKMRFFQTVEKTLGEAFLQGLYPPKEYGKVWDLIAYHSFYQDLLAPRAKPDKKTLENSAQVLQDVIDELQPHVILVMAKMVWANMLKYTVLPIDWRPRGLEPGVETFQMSNLGDLAMVGVFPHPTGASHLFKKCKPVEAIQIIQTCRWAAAID